MKPAASDPAVRRAQDEGIIIQHAVTGRAGDLPAATPDTFGQATDPRAVRRDLTAIALVRHAEKAAAKAWWTATGRLSPGRAGQLRPVCRYIGL
ncbi:MAG: hypothetical protein AB7V08_13920 [Elusimicrobiales bacterium]